MRQSQGRAAMQMKMKSGKFWMGMEWTEVPLLLYNKNLISVQSGEDEEDEVVVVVDLMWCCDDIMLQRNLMRILRLYLYHGK